MTIDLKLSLPFPTHYTTVEGGKWLPCLEDLPPADCFAFRMSDGKVWDRVTGWRTVRDFSMLEPDVQGYEIHAPEVAERAIYHIEHVFLNHDTIPAMNATDFFTLLTYAKIGLKVDAKAQAISPLTVSFLYLNHHGKLALRTVDIDTIEYITNPAFNYLPGWFLSGYCHTKKARRSFAFTNMAFDGTQVPRFQFAVPRAT